MDSKRLSPSVYWSDRVSVNATAATAAAEEPGNVSALSLTRRFCDANGSPVFLEY